MGCENFWEVFLRSVFDNFLWCLGRGYFLLRLSCVINSGSVVLFVVGCSIFACAGFVNGFGVVVWV